MAKGGIGLRCMATGCDNPILYSEIRMFISEDVQKKLDERILQESIGMASIDKLERSHTRDPNNPNCKHCNSKCLLFEDANKRDDQLIKEIREGEGAKT
uniref:Uncharacterized protein n=1 Tax=Meloidogyne javanica TaxID=6303 RepID=A0A915N5Z9_MELJA